MAKVPKIQFKAGDDFSLGLTVTQKTSAPAIAAAEAVEAAQKIYDDLVAADPQVPLDIEAALVVLEAARDAYQTAIIVDITSWGITSSIKWCGKLISTLIVEKTDETLGRFQISQIPEVTELWKPRIYDIDIQFDVNDKKTSSQTFKIDVVRDVTNE